METSDDKNSAATLSGMAPSAKHLPRPKAVAGVADRIIIQHAENEMLVAWQEQIEERFEGFSPVTKSELANFVIRKHPSQLSDSELNEIGNQFYDEVRWLNWALAKIRQSKKDGVTLTLDELIAERRRAEPLTKRLSSKRNNSKTVISTNDDAQAVDLSTPSDERIT